MPHETTRLRLPDGGAARLFTLSDAPGCAWGIVVAAKPEQARPESLMRRGGLSAMLTHAEGIAWPWKHWRSAGRCASRSIAWPMPSAARNGWKGAADERHPSH